MRSHPSVAVLAALALSLPAAARAFTHVELGAQLRDRELPTVDGAKAPWLGSARATLFVFFRPGQDHSFDTLKQVAVLEKELEGKGVRFVLITSDGYDAGSVRDLVREAGVRAPVLVDVGDALYGELGVSLHPSSGVADAKHRLSAYQHFLKVNQLDVLRGRILVALGELSAEGMARIVAPPPSHTGTTRDVAMRRVNLGRALLVRGHADQAAENARRALELSPGLPEAKALLADAERALR
ncbi:MAG TPA: hypothetical protein VFP65_28210 [Anaeromyxobacteraceae bacterium]|nr:hypothetical protein [Anaeromyxobacteraceae bacterium]